jgi:hypothetical protein
VHKYSYRVSEHDPERPWIVLEQRHETIQLDHDVEFFEGSAARSHTGASRATGHRRADRATVWRDGPAVIEAQEL